MLKFLFLYHDEIGRKFCQKFENVTYFLTTTDQSVIRNKILTFGVRVKIKVDFFVTEKLKDIFFLLIEKNYLTFDEKNLKNLVNENL